MITKEALIAEIEKLPQEYLSAVYKLIKDFESAQGISSKSTVMSKLRGIKISASEDFSRTVDLYDAGEGDGAS